MMSYSKNDPETIQAMFSSIAHAYDRTNALLSFQMHRYWNRALIRSLSRERSPYAILDLCCGTGEIGLHFLKRRNYPCQLVFLDFCEEMLACARDKLANTSFTQPHMLSYLQADAQAIPLADVSVDTVALAYGLRNVKNPRKCLEEIFRVMRPGGMLGILELTQPIYQPLRWMHYIYLKLFLPRLGKILTSNSEAYRYLCNSIHSFIHPEELCSLLKELGFVYIKVSPLAGGIATLILAEKPIIR
jgi:demethylmenaquinone methyltransferase/2-methoxy-6-polyprenyl-1,4-benzoquinol methylase